MPTTTTEPAESSGRAQQRRRTRHAILYAARELLDGGTTPTVAEAADAASVSRATAYRYYPSQESLLAECILVPDFPLLPDELFANAGNPTDPEDRVVAVHDFMYDFISAREVPFRHFLRSQLLLGMQDKQTDRLLRPGFRVALLDAALEPLNDQVPADALDRLKRALAVLIGTEAMLVGKDVLQIEDDDARAANAWACRLLVRAVEAEYGAPKKSRRRKT